MVVHQQAPSPEVVGKGLMQAPVWECVAEVAHLVATQSTQDLIPLVEFGRAEDLAVVEVRYCCSIDSDLAEGEERTKGSQDS